MKKFLKIGLILLFIGAIIWGFIYMKNTSTRENETYEVDTPFITDINLKATATGEVKPKEVIEIKPNIPGMISEILVKEGDLVKKGQLIASIKVIPSVSNLNTAKQAINSASITVNQESKNFNRTKTLHDQGVVPRSDYDNALATYQAAQQNLQSAQYNYKVALTGIAPGLEQYATTQIRSTTDGMILDVPVEVGNMVQEINNFSTGTTIAKMADVSQMIFEGKVDEAEVGKLEVGMPLKVSIGALPNIDFEAALDFVAPLGIENNGVVQFQIKAPVKLKDNLLIRAGYSANAEILLSSANKVLAIKSAHLRYNDEGRPYVEVRLSQEGKEPTYEIKYLELGLTDGINVEVKRGLKRSDKIKVWNTDLESHSNPGPY